ncbi:molybdopterin-dependent oxidoreductase [Desulfitobacterium chlororespirans]|uniref:Anaerobic selenocysteine-containing dehydrogenase n=1 Tax=Desulfitobacterium chlororespirans DSM 11544 TaxID=1121395 RepID=A0A1M7UJB0_9FIRM|nr:molybdopterin-dependent oxidoreductase [Desulfitobacterium chlororespirans]SHN82977.1 Anaerobic selenocysteine-containing dehydrogenase [Desulfitobacterium chlororespirans DSM 11544]
MESIYSNVCSSDCRASCRIRTKVQNGRIVGIQGDPIDEYTFGSLCAKGYAHLQRIYAADRITYPMKQLGKGTGKWVRISWDQALHEIAQKLIDIRIKHNTLLPVCLNKYLGTVGLLSRSIDGFFNSIGYITLMTGSPCVATGVDALSLSFGTCKKPVPEDMLNARLILIWGGNPAWTTLHQMRLIFEAREKGAVLVVIDPVLSATAARSDLYVQIKPGADLELALGIAKVLWAENLVDKDFLTNYASDWPSFRASLEKLNLENIAAATDIPVAEIVNLARLIGRTKPMTISLGAGVQHTAVGGQGFRAISALAAMTGNIGIPGGNIHYATFEPWEFAGEFISLKPPQDLRGSPDGNGQFQHRYVGTGRFGELSAMEPPIELLWVASHNPVAQAPNSGAVKEALQSIGTVVVADQFLTPTSHYADYFLPVASHYEYEDIVISYWHYGAAINQKAIDPLGESKSDFAIMRELAITLNKLAPGFSTFPSERPAAEWLDLEMKPQYPRLGIAHYQDLIEHYRRIDLPPVPWQDRTFTTASRKYEFLSVPALTEDPSSPPQLRQGSEEHDYPFRLLRIRSFATLNSQYRNLASMEVISEKTRVLLNPETAYSKGIEEGINVKVYNQLGQIVLPASLSDSIPPDVLSVYIGCDSKHDIELNSIIALIDTDLGEACSDAKGLAFNNTYVNLVRV